jgi:menaquinone-9 beta-reductase
VTGPGQADVLIVGAGPAGSVAAALLARGGMQVLLVDRAKGSRQPPYSVLLSGPALRAMASLRIPLPTDARPVDRIELRFGARSRREAAGAAAVCDRGQLVRALRRAAVRSGARFIRGTLGSVTGEPGRYQAVIHEPGQCQPGQCQPGLAAAATVLRVTVRHVIVTSGCVDAGDPGLGGMSAPAKHNPTGPAQHSSELTQHNPTGPAQGNPAGPAQGNPGSVQHSSTGLACAQRFTGTELGARVTLAFAAPPATAPDTEVASAWALPGADGIVTVGAAMGYGTFEDGPSGARPSGAGTIEDGPAALMRKGLRLLSADPGLAMLRPAGPLVSGRLNIGFAPSQVQDAPVIVAGEAAGLVNPFTAEGLSYAIQSAELAARAILANPADPDAARGAYAGSLAATFVGYFETAHHAARRYHLTWRILAAGAESDHPFFAKGRRAVLLPEGFSGLAADARMRLADADAARLVPFLAACDEVAIASVRAEWPFLARLVMADDRLAPHRLRPAAPFFAALAASGRLPDPRRATLGAAIELAMLGAVAILGPLPPPAEGRGVDWVLTTTVLAGDFLLAQASRLVATSAPEVSWSFADWLGELTALRAARLAGRPDVSAGALYASLLEFPARIGAQLGGGQPTTVQALRRFGHHCGIAFQCAEDILALRGERTRLDTTLSIMFKGRFSGMPDTLSRPSLEVTDLEDDQGLRAAALAQAADGCATARQRALDLLAAVPDPASQRILRAFIEAVAAPAELVSPCD